VQIVDGLAASGPERNTETEARVAAEVKALCALLPLYQGM